MVKPSIAVIGCGFVGLYNSLFFCGHGFRVHGIEKDPRKVAMLKKGMLTFHDPLAKKRLKAALKSGSFTVSDDPASASRAGVIFIAVGTPNDASGKADLRSLQEASAEVGRAMRQGKGYRLVVVKSTVPPGTTGNVVKPLIESASGKRCGTGFGLCMSPEFLREGFGIQDLEKPDRVVIGEHDRKAGDLLERLHRHIYPSTMPIVRTNLVNAELIKYASNSFLATKISFINSIANLCERLDGSDVAVVAKGMGLDRRISPHFLHAGVGFGGYCLPKDLEALIGHSKGVGYDPLLLRATRDVNRAQNLRPIEHIAESMEDISGKRFAILGLAFKAGTDDIRNAPSIPVIESLIKHGGDVRVYDPLAMSTMKGVFGERIQYCKTARDCLRGADCCIILTEWEEFRGISPRDFRSLMREPFVIDCRRIYDPEKYRKALRFRAIGLGP